MKNNIKYVQIQYNKGTDIILDNKEMVMTTITLLDEPEGGGGGGIKYFYPEIII